MNFARRQVVEQLEDLRIAKWVSDSLWLQGLWERRRGAVDRLEVTTLHRLDKEAIKLLTARLSHPRALFPLVEALHRQCLAIHSQQGIELVVQQLPNH